MLFERLRSTARTLRFRMAAWNASVVLMTTIATFVALREAIRFTLLDEIDKVLVEDLHEIVLMIPARDYPDSTAIFDDLNRKAQAHQLHGWYVRFLDERGTSIWASQGAPAETSAKSELTPLQEDRPLSINGFRRVQLQHAFEANATGTLTLRVGSSLENIERDMQRLDQQMALVAAGMLIFAPLCGYWLAGRAIRPLSEIIHTTSRLRPARLDERLPIRRTGDELDQLARTVNALLDRIATYLEQKRDFLANAAHELRTPLAAIRSSIEVAAATGRTNEEYEQLLVDLIKECSALELLVNQLLLLAETEADALQIYGEIVNWGEIVEQSMDMFQPVAEFRGIQLTSHITARMDVEGNRHHLRQVLNNLLDNALKCTPAGGSIQVTLERDESGQRAILRVSDTGIGIGPEDLPHVFERFFRSDKARQREPTTRGTGLGLSICEAVVHSHRGQISVVSQLGAGATFTVEVPLAQASVNSASHADATGMA